MICTNITRGTANTAILNLTFSIQRNVNSTGNDNKKWIHPEAIDTSGNTAGGKPGCFSNVSFTTRDLVASVSAL